MSRSLLIRTGYFVGALLMLPVVLFLWILVLEDSPINPTPAGGFGADIRLVYLMILGGPPVVLGLIIVIITTGTWLFTGRSKKED